MVDAPNTTAPLIPYGRADFRPTVRPAGRATARNCLLVLVSAVAALALCEAALRLFHPRYAHLTVPPSEARWLPYQVAHPDTGETHPVVYNNLGNRQHRHFTDADLAGAVNVAFFGDSFTENLRMAAHYSFTEILDFLLNARAQGDGFPALDEHPETPQRTRVNVLNFGMEGTGIGVQYTRYRELPFKQRLRHVFYVQVWNDYEDLQGNAGWSLHQSGRLVQHKRAPPRAWTRFIGRLHITYLALDVWHRRRPHDAVLSDANAQALFADDAPGLLLRDAVAIRDDEVRALFAALLLQWRHEVEANGGSFHIVRVPVRHDDLHLAPRERSPWAVVDLRECFRQAIPDFRYEDWRYERDIHWNEAGNMVAAHCLYRHLEGPLDLPPASDETLAEMRHAYYAAFQGDADWRGQRWMPDPPWALPGGDVRDDVAKRIVARYQALGAAATRRQYGIIRAVRATEPVLRAAGWNVHLGRAERQLVYVKDPCEAGDPAAGIFLYWRPWNLADLDPAKRLVGQGRERHGPTRVWAARQAGACVFAKDLPAALLKSVYTGQRNAAGDVVWEGEFAVDDRADAEAALTADRRAYDAIARTAPAARSVWNIHARPAQRKIAYLKAPCEVHDTIGTFFLRVRPADVIRAGSGRDGFLETLFDFRAQQPHDRTGVLWKPKEVPLRAPFTATMVDGKCMLTAPMPEWRIGTVWTGVHGPDGALLWQTRFYFDTDGLRRAWRSTRWRQPNGSSVFDVFHHAGSLTYVRDPCAPADIRRFFLHIAGDPEGDPGATATMNLDFDFVDRGALFEGKCVAVAPLPPDAAGAIRTGQFTPADGEAWRVEFPLQ